MVADGTKGFSLVELLVVLLIIGMVAAALPSAWMAVVPGARFEAQSNELAALLRKAGSEALAQNQEMIVRFDVTGRSAVIESLPEAEILALTEGTSLSVLSIRGQLNSDGNPAIRFFPDGSSTGGRILLSQDDRTVTAKVDWLTSGISMASE